MRRATRSQSRVASLTKSPSPSPSKKSVTPASLSVISIQSPTGQDTTTLSSTKIQLTKDLDVDDDRDELDLIGSPLSDDEVSWVFSFPPKLSEPDQGMKQEPAIPQRESVDEEERPLPHLSPQPDEKTEGEVNDAGAQGVEQDENAMKIDEPIVEELAISTTEAAGHVQPVVGSFSRDVPEKSINTGIEKSDAQMKDSEDEMDNGSEEEVSRTVDRPPSLPPVQSTSSNEPIKSSIPFIPLGSSSPIQTAPTPRLPIILLAPSNSSANAPTFTFDENLFAGPEQSRTPTTPLTQQHQYSPNYPLPPLKSLPPEFNRKVKTKSRRKEKEKDREREKEGGREKENIKKEDWFPMGINRWAATLNANPVWKRVMRPSKCLSSREWAVRASFIPTLNHSVVFFFRFFR